MLEYSEVKERVYIDLDGTPYEVLSSHVFRKQQRKPVNQTKLKNLITGKVTERSFHASEKVAEADIATRKIKYLYSNKGDFWFCAENNPKDRFSVSAETVGDQGKFLKENTVIDGVTYKDEIIGVKVPIKVDLLVTEAPPGEKGNTAQGGNKQVTLETGAVVNVPLFVNEGDTVRINTVDGEYTERVQK